jgi:hypothetical protein
VSLRDRPALVELRVSRATPSSTGSTVRQRRPEAAVTLHLGRYGGRHPLGVEIDQGECRALIDDVGAGAGDDVRPRRAINRLLSGDLNLVRQVHTQGAERERL